MTGPRLRMPDAMSTEYIAWSEAERHPANTVRRRRSVLRSIGNPGTATREDVEEWWARRRHLKDSSRANDLAVLRAFYTWCQIWELRTDDPTVRLRPPKLGKGSPKPFSRREVAAILTAVDHDPPLRRAVLLGAGAGLRISEVAALRWTDIDTDTGMARVTGKGRKTRLVALSGKLLEALLPDTGGNVVTGRPRGWAASTLGGKVNTAIHDAGLAGTFHKLRHHYGSLAYQRTKDPKAVADQMGHASVATTMSFYAAAADDAARAVADAVTEDW